MVLLFCTAAFADTQVYLLRGWFGVFSAGMAALADDLQSKGIKAEAIGHLAWRATVAKIASSAPPANQPARPCRAFAGANNVIEMARELEKKKIPSTCW